MDKVRKDKLLELRQKKNEAKKKEESQKHSELIQAVNSLHALFDQQNEKNDKNTDLLLRELSRLGAFKDEVAQVRQAIKDLPKVDKVTISNIADIVATQKEIDLTEVTNAVKTLTIAVKNQSVDEVAISNKTPEQFIPTRRVREVRGKLIFDDEPLQVSVVGGGGSMRVPTVTTPGGKSAVAVANADGTPIGGGSGGSGDASAAKQDEQTALLEQIEQNTANISIDADSVNLNTDEIEAKLDTIAGQQQQDALTDAELRAAPVVVDTGLTQPTTPSDTQPVSGTVALDSATLAALENITVLVSSGEISLDSATLAALENIVVSGTVELGATTLAALETINAVVSGTVALDSATLSALENITATVSGPLTVDKGTGWVDPQTDALTDAELRAAPVDVDTGLDQPLTDAQLRATPIDVNASLDTTGLSTEAKQDTGNSYLAQLVDLLNNRYTSTKEAAVATVSMSGDTTIVTPSAGNAIRLYWFSATQDPDDSSAPLVKLLIGGTEYYRFFGTLAHAEQFEGAADESVVLNLATNANYSVTVHYEEFTP